MALLVAIQRTIRLNTNSTGSSSHMHHTGIAKPKSDKLFSFKCRCHSMPTRVSYPHPHDIWPICINNFHCLRSKLKYFQTTTKTKWGDFNNHCAQYTDCWFRMGVIRIFPLGTKLIISDSLLYPGSTRTLLNYRDTIRMVFISKPMTPTKRSIFS